MCLYIVLIVYSYPYQLLVVVVYPHQIVVVFVASLVHTDFIANFVFTFAMQYSYSSNAHTYPTIIQS